MERLDDFAAGEVDVMDLSVLDDLDFGPLRQGVDTFHADTVQSA